MRGSQARTVLLIEIVSRVLKNLLRSWQRDTMRVIGEAASGATSAESTGSTDAKSGTGAQSRAQMPANMLSSEPSEFHLRQTAVRFLGLVSGYHSGSANFWQSLVIPGAHSRFGSLALTEEEGRDLYSACSPHLYTIVRRLLKMTGAVSSL